MKPTVPRIERWLSDIEAALIPPPRKRLRVIVYQAVEDKEKALAKLAECNPVLHAGHTVKDISWSDDMAAAKEKALAEHIATHPEDAGLTITDIDWIGFEIVFEVDDNEYAQGADDKDRAVDGGSQKVEPLRPSGRDYDLDWLSPRLAGVRVVRSAMVAGRAGRRPATRPQGEERLAECPPDAGRRDTRAAAPAAREGAVLARLYVRAGRADDAKGLPCTIRSDRVAGQDAI